MAHAVTPSDVVDAAAICRRVLGPVMDRDWFVPAGDLAWDVRATLIHVCDAVGWYAAHLAVQARHRLRVDVRVPDDATNAEVLDVLEATAATLALVARGAAGRPRLPLGRHGRCGRLRGDGLRRAPRPRLGRLPRPRVGPGGAAGPGRPCARATVPLGAPRRRSLARTAVGERTCRPRGRSPPARVGLGVALRTGRRVGWDDPEMERFAPRTLRLGRRGRALAAGVAITAPAGPRRVDVAAAYDLGVDAYVSLWSPVILPPAEAVVAGLGLEGTPRARHRGRTGVARPVDPRCRAGGAGGRPGRVDRDVARRRGSHPNLGRERRCPRPADRRGDRRRGSLRVRALPPERSVAGDRRGGAGPADRRTARHRHLGS